MYCALKEVSNLLPYALTVMHSVRWQSVVHGSSSSRLSHLHWLPVIDEFSLKYISLSLHTKPFQLTNPLT